MKQLCNGHNGELLFYIYANLPRSAIVSLPKHPLLTSKPATMTQSAQITIPPNHHKALRSSRSKKPENKVNKRTMRKDFVIVLYCIIAVPISTITRVFQHRFTGLGTLC